MRDASRADNIAIDEDTVAYSQYIESSDHDLLATLYYKHERALLNYLLRKTGSQELAEEALIDTWTKLTKASIEFDPTKKFQPYLYTIATNAAMDICRREKRHSGHLSLNVEFRSLDGSYSSDLASQIPSREREPSAIASDREDYSRIRTSISKLKDYEQDYLEARFVEGKKYREIDQDVPLPTIKNRIKGALIKIRKDLGELTDEDKEFNVLQKINEARRIESVAHILPEKERIILINRLVHGMKIREIAEEMNLGLQVAKSILYRAIKKLEKASPDVSGNN